MIFCQDTLHVYFLYGSKPKKEFKETENHWFGGVHGGHVGISVNQSNILHFLPTGNKQIFSQKERRARFYESSALSFWRVFGSCDSVKSLVIHIPIDSLQANLFIEIFAKYQRKCPYDYALFGYRCASASAEILGQLGILNSSRGRHYVLRYFYPKQLRKNLEKRKRQDWIFGFSKGNKNRIWES